MNGGNPDELTSDDVLAWLTDRLPEERREVVYRGIRSGRIDALLGKLNETARRIMAPGPEGGHTLKNALEFLERNQQYLGEDHGALVPGEIGDKADGPERFIRGRGEDSGGGRSGSGRGTAR